MGTGNFRTKFIVNPASANGSTQKLWNQIEGVIRESVGAVDASFTARANHATELTHRALLDGFEMVVGVGGDGTINEVVNGFFNAGSLINPEAVLGVISRGTGSDFIKTLGIPKEIAAASRTLCGHAVKRCDVGRFTCKGHDGSDIERYFINIADFGIGGETVERVNRTTKALGGFVSFFYGAVSTLLTYKGKRVRVRVDDSYEAEKVVQNVIVANGQYFGGGMWIAPRAQVDDGLFDILIIDDMGRLESFRNIVKLYKGAHLDHPKVLYLQGKTVVADSPDVVLLDVEGEQIGRLPARFDIIPAAVKVKVEG
ncbi:MAG: diacylglycerol kinase family lipid kinase [Candidatus Abyssobacteria bacterium SURF_17]|uniref:Diacylglycerol kinase family lipid kinase n=1 Tax=Candidatus Abyssobacteria bacterium SURF_17 TaxID=2093361 RepID=A0A419F2N6_9BACT|nr:MAG: diacylglycerol kinase family lipid kinase [Candidatus Abyssubacteria bacterium SURF_17]